MTTETNPTSSRRIHNPSDWSRGLLGQSWNLAGQGALGEQLFDLKFAVCNPNHRCVARHGLQNDPVIFNVVGPSIFTKELSLLFQFRAVPSQKRSPRITHMFYAYLFGFGKGFDETLRYPWMPFED